MGFKIVPYDDAMFSDKTGIQPSALEKTFLANKTKTGTIMYLPSKDWATPIVTGHKYKVHWGQSGIDWTAMSLTMSERWRETDKGIYLVHNYSDVRSNYTVNVTKPYKLNFKNASITLPVDLTKPETFEIGQNTHYDHNETRQIHWLVNGKNMSGMEKTLNFVG